MYVCACVCVCVWSKVSDGAHTGRSTVLAVRVTPLTLSVWNVSQSVIVQGEVSALINNIHVVTSGPPERIIYNITRSPRHGELYRYDRPVRRFR